MTAEQMQYNFELKRGEHDSLDKEFMSYDVAMFLNASQNDLVEGFYSSRINPGSRYFEMDERSRAMLALLIESTTIDSFDSADSALHDNAVFVDLPANFLYALEESCGIAYTDCNSDAATTTSRVLPIRHDEYRMNINNVYKKPWRKLVWRMDFGDSGGKKKHELIYGTGITIQNYKLRYLRSPVAINIVTGVDCELHDILHEEVVDRAIALAVRATIPKTEPNLQV